MEFVDLILNFCALLLWLTWRSLGFVRARPSIATHSLMAGLRAPDLHGGGSRWPYLIALIALLGLRSFFYHSVGPAVQWTPALDFGPIGIAFRSDFYWRVALYSALSFGKFLAVCYLWVLALSAINAKAPEYDSIHSWVRMQLGVFDRVPLGMKLAGPLVFGSVAWATLSWFFARDGMAPPQESGPQFVKEAFFMGIYAYLPLKIPLLVILVCHAINSYVYLGNHEWLHYLDKTAKNLLIPLRWLRLGKFDLAPLAGIALLIGVESYGRAKLAAEFGVDSRADDPIEETFGVDLQRKADGDDAVELSQPGEPRSGATDRGSDAGE